MKTAIANLFRLPKRKETAFEVQEELQFHIDMLERKYTQSGMSVTAAKAAALKRFGNLERVKQQCVDISRRSSPLQRILKVSTILIALTGLSIHAMSSDYKVARIGQMLIMIAIATRFLLYVRGLSGWSFPSGTKQTSVSLFTKTPDDTARS